ncbi:hypothetical protein [Methanobrevibacter sp.]|uniref:hypothetical protein n=1 Tax=Methanobrevibacter sp. TaxID=66852 RepID=UPI0038903275
MISKEIIDENFFIIDSNNIEETEEKLYGFALQNGKIVQDEDIISYTHFDKIGAYVLIQNKNSEITISQDMIGSYGVYIYRNEDYFAISNSFLKLMDYLKYDNKLTLNKDFAYISLLPKTISSIVYEKTLINEIICIPRNTEIHIDTKTKQLSFIELDFNENSIPIDSEKGLKTLDEWFFKWIDIIRSLKEKTNNLSLDLSGGFDTRVVLSILLAANIDLNSIRVNSIDNDHHNHDEDFRIASQIAQRYGFGLNSKLDVNYYNYPDIQTVLYLSCYVKLGFNKQMNFKLKRSQDPIYRITGMGGAVNRGWPKGNATSHVVNIVNRAKRFEPSFAPSCEKIITDSLQKVKKRNPNIEDDTFQWSYYKETRLRNHFGKLTVENYLSNNLALSPLIDQDLFKLKINTEECRDSSLLISLIFVRYCPELLEFEVEGGREFKQEVIEYAKRINEIYPYEAKEFKRLSSVKTNKTPLKIKNNKRIDYKEINSYLKSVFKSNFFKYEFKKYTPSKIYDLILYSIENRSYFPIQEAYPAFAIIYTVNSLKYYSKNRELLISEWFDKFLDTTYEIDDQINPTHNPEFKLQLEKFITGRMDIKNINSKNNGIEIIENSDKSSKIDFPFWLKDEEGSGCSIESAAGDLDITLRCIEDGELNINLRGVNETDRNKKRYPIYIDFTKFLINGKEIINKNTLVWHDDPFLYVMPVKNEQIVEIHLEWMPINKNSDTEYHRLVAENKYLQKENDRLKQLNEEILNSKSWKMTNPLRKIRNG